MAAAVDVQAKVAEVLEAVSTRAPSTANLIATAVSAAWTSNFTELTGVVISSVSGSCP